jgi:hypothetical protein
MRDEDARPAELASASARKSCRGLGLECVSQDDEDEATFDCLEGVVLLNRACMCLSGRRYYGRSREVIEHVDGAVERKHVAMLAGRVLDM